MPVFDLFLRSCSVRVIILNALSGYHYNLFTYVYLARYNVKVE
jgi:hypothetical protein